MTLVRVCTQPYYYESAYDFEPGVMVADSCGQCCYKYNYMEW